MMISDKMQGALSRREKADRKQAHQDWADKVKQDKADRKQAHQDWADKAKQDKAVRKQAHQDWANKVKQDKAVRKQAHQDWAAKVKQDKAAKVKQDRADRKQAHQKCMWKESRTRIVQSESAKGVRGNSRNMKESLREQVEVLGELKRELHTFNAEYNDCYTRSQIELKEAQEPLATVKAVDLENVYNMYEDLNSKPFFVATKKSWDRDNDFQSIEGYECPEPVSSEQFVYEESQLSPEELESRIEAASDTSDEWYIPCDLIIEDNL